MMRAPLSDFLPTIVPASPSNEEEASAAGALDSA
jgi:hypothetical protein